jgi:TM2 domain-containing membrane protein YozV
MTNGSDSVPESNEGQPLEGQPAYEQPPAPQPAYGQPAYPQPAYGQPSPAAPFGVHPVTGVPYSEKSKLVAALLQILIPLGLGRFYIGDNRTGTIQLVVTLVTCGVGGIWPFVDGIMMLIGDPVDAQGRPLRS